MTTFVNCPTCSKRLEWSPLNAFRPFCSERCKQIDLGAWAAEKYTIPGKPADTLPEDTEHSDLN
ncbi:DNA gyrase inhibitor YacG [Pararobbsia silviterrae]|uniref:DNA gyrase inhibitor YacG n=1 Tax=Pararobbsia silviterrae TaxID=1792498 RepID=A0A494XF66_9BURK|nr:DNA gyrase inhibitor YacG [Pararobbsia silviterrae]RKP48522.1 DNA gyrase inhibitor YacG [Pararobbsia silviterrae]